MAVTPYTIDSPVPSAGYGLRRLRNGITIDIPATHPEVFDPEGLESNWADIDVYDVDTVAKFPVGTVLKINQKYYMYTEFGDTLAAGELLQSEGPDGAHDLLPGVVGAAGDTKFTVNEAGAAIVKNEYAGGNIIMAILGTPGYEYEILAHAVGSAAMEVKILGNLAVAISTSDDIAFLKHAAKEVIKCPTTLTGAPFGVSKAVQADGQFGWSGVKGPHAVKTEGTVTVGYEARPSETTAGTITLQKYDEANDADLGTIGTVVDVGATGGFSLVNFHGRGVV